MNNEMKLYAIFKDGSRKEIDLDSAGVGPNASQLEAMVMARKELTFLEEKNLARWEFEEDFICAACQSRPWGADTLENDHRRIKSSCSTIKSTNS